VLWIGLSFAIAASLVAIVAVVGRRRTSARRTVEVDPMFSGGIALTGAGVALATTVGNVMYGVMTVGLVIMAVGAHRTRRHHDG